jgi:Tfp pilus assembly protein PilF
VKRPAAFAAVALTVTLWAVLGPAVTALAPDQRVVELRNRGYAELENEQPAKAEAVFTELTRLDPDEPLGHADLAVALLRQQEFDRALAAIDRALALDPQAGGLRVIKADILQWSGRTDEAATWYRRAADADPDDVEIQYALYRFLTSVARDPDPAVVDATVARLAALRPENLVVILQQGRRAVEAGDRAVASAAFLRVGELLWQAPEGSDQLYQAVIDALESGDTAAAKLPAQRLENVLKITAMYRESLRELSSGIQGIPLRHLRGEGPAQRFGQPLDVRFTGEQWSAAAGSGSALVSGDFDGDQRADVARVSAGTPPTLEVRLAATATLVPVGEARGVVALLAADLDNDGLLDLIGHGPEALRYWRGGGDGTFREASADVGLTTARGAAAAVLDFDIEGDLDLVVGGAGLDLLRNALDGPLEAVGERTLPPIAGPIRALAVSDLDRDGDLDLAVATAAGIRWLDNQRQGAFRDRTAAAGLGAAPGLRALAAADLDDDGFPELIAAGDGVIVLHNHDGAFSPWAPAAALATAARFDAVVPFDADNDGRLDLAFGGPGGVVVAARRGDGFGFLPVNGGPATATAVAADDFDHDGDLDLVAHGPDGLFLLTNEGGQGNHWLTIHLRGLTKGNSKNNVFGLGSVVEVKAGAAYQFREVTGDTVHFGLGSVERADLLRVVWTNGVPQNRLDPEPDQWLVEEQLLKGSCPLLYVLAGGEVRFVTDLLWNAPAGLPLAPGAWAPADPSELVAIGEIAPDGGRWDLRITEELWEAAFLDAVRLWVVDHPAAVEVASSLKVGAGEAGDDRVLAVRDLRPVAAAWDAAGRDVTERVRRRDEIYADGWRKSPYQGVADAPWSFTFDLGAAPGAPVRLWLDGWIFPADASLNLAVAQRRDLAPQMPRLEVETADGWSPLLPAMGHPAGKTKTMVVDTPPLPAGAHRLRIVSGQWLSWDRIRWSTAPADAEPRVTARLLPSHADLRYRGFSALVRQAPNAPHAFDYARVSTRSPWLPFPGDYTRYGDVRELLAATDDRSVVLAAGDEMRLLFDAAGLPDPPPGWRRTLFLESHGWDKDADRNTYAPERMEPLPFRAMRTYGEPFPRTPGLDAYRARWLTRRVGDSR